MVSLLRFCSAMALLCGLCCVLASSASASKIGFSTASGSDLPFCHFKLEDGDVPNLQVFIKVFITPVHDDFRNIASSPLLYAGNNASLTGYINHGLSSSQQSGDEVDINFTGDGYIWFASLSGTGKWPSGTPARGYLPQGQYVIGVQVIHAAGNSENSAIVGFTAGSNSMTGTQPGPQYQDHPVLQSPADAPPSNSTIGTAKVRVSTQGSGGTVNAGANYVCTLAGSFIPTGTTTGPDGSATFPNLSAGTYVVTVSGSHTGTAGAVVYDSLTKSFVVTGGNTTTVFCTFGNTGTGSADVTSTAPVTTGGTPFPTQSWFQQMLQAAFVPQQSSLDTVQADGAQFANWGPGQLLGELSTAFSSPVSSMPSIAIPNYYFDMTANGYRGQWRSSGTSTSVDPTGGMTSDSGWVTLRAWMGGAVWLGFALWVGRSLMPKQVV